MMRILLLLLCLMTNVSHANDTMPFSNPLFKNKMYSILEQNKRSIEMITAKFEFADKIDSKSFDFQKFDAAIESLHPTLGWMVLRYLSEKSTGYRKERIKHYIQTSLVVKEIPEKLKKLSNATRTCLTFQKKVPLEKVKTLSRKQFMEHIHNGTVMLQGLDI
jgi:hypothetical protein